MIKIHADKTAKRGNILVRQQSRCTIPFLVMWSWWQQVWTINITWAHREKPQWTKHNRTKAPKDKNQSGQNIQKRQSFSTSRIKVYNPISAHVITITTGVDNQHHVGAQRKAPLDKSTIGQKPQRIKIKADKTPKRGNILVRQQSMCTIPFLIMWSRWQQVWTVNIMWVHREKPQWTKEAQDKSPKG